MLVNVDCFSIQRSGGCTVGCALEVQL